jgi:hypothetical protein
MARSVTEGAVLAVDRLAARDCRVVGLRVHRIGSATATTPAAPCGSWRGSLLLDLVGHRRSLCPALRRDRKENTDGQSY